MTRILFALVFSIRVAGWGDVSQGAEPPIEFNRDIRPILSEHCFACHGPDKNKREADLRLDREVGLLGSQTSPGVVRPGKPEESLLVQRILSTEPDEQMPPAEFGKPLNAAQIEQIRAWIKQGGQFEGHWSFQPVKPQVPAPHAKSTSVTPDHPIDQWIDHRLEQQGLKGASMADRTTLIRRLSFDIIGLPPTPVEVETFLHDEHPDAYSHLVDRLLASPHYGERMAMWWLDLVRYADSVGYHGDQPMSVSPFRDYVIQAFNDNVPFDQFTREQLAGDLIATKEFPGETAPQNLEQIRKRERLQVAAGYNRLGMMSAEGGVQDQEYLAKYIAERVRNVGGTWLGVTLGCCECHDHKYDPFSAKDFYSMAAFFADIEEKGLYSGANDTGVWGPSIKVPDDTQRQELMAVDRELAESKQRLDKMREQLDLEQQTWEDKLPRWQVLRPVSASAANGTTLTVLDDGSILASGPRPDNDRYILRFEKVPSAWRALRLEVLPDPSLPNQGPGRAGNGNFVLSELRLYSLEEEGKRPVEIPQAWQQASASYEQTGAAAGNPYGKWKIEAAIDRDAKGAKWGWAVMEKAGSEQHAVFQLQQPEPMQAAADFELVLEQNLDNPQHTLGKFRIAITDMPEAKAFVGAVSGLQTALDTPRDARTPEQRKQLRDYYQEIAPAMVEPRREHAALQKRRQELDAKITSMLATRATAPRMVRVLARGNWMDATGEVVTPNTPQALPPMPASSTRATRWELAEWIVSQENPLTARVLVNRIWKQFMGSGLSRRLDDFGSQGESPTHPELLDWLAHQMVAEGWDIKQTIRRIVSSQTYQRASNVNPSQWEADPMNRWYARQNRFRLEAELVRDNALAVSGLLVPTVGGRSVKPYQPPGYWMYLNFPQREWQNGAGPELYRRGLYTHWQRQYLHPSLTAFDAPSREECTADRPRSNTPLQSLVLLNDPSFVEAARHLAQQALQTDPSNLASHPPETDPPSNNSRSNSDLVSWRLEWIWKRVLSRIPNDREVEMMNGLIAKHHQQYVADTIAVDRLLAVGQNPVPAGMDRAELAAWTSVARVILNLHESIVRP